MFEGFAIIFGSVSLLPISVIIQVPAIFQDIKLTMVFMLCPAIASISIILFLISNHREKKK